MKINGKFGYECNCFAERFQKVLLERLMTALKQKEELSLNPTDWVYRAAKNREALQEGGTLRYVTLGLNHPVCLDV